MGADQSTGCAAGCAAGPKSLFSWKELKEWKHGKGKNAVVSVAAKYHVNGDLAKKYELTSKILGTGVSGPVFLAHNKAKGSRQRRSFAVKTVKKQRGMELKEIKSEVMIFLSIDHPNIARLEDVFDTKSEISLVMEMLQGGELYDRVCETGAYSQDRARDACKAMFQAVAYLHGQEPPIVHRDLKPENFLYTQKGSDHLKLIDFGFSTVWDSSVLPRMSDSVGTKAYMAPEVLGQKSYTEKCDTFSLGVITYILLTGHPPFESSANMNAYRLYDQQTFKRLPQDAREFVRSLLEPDPSARLGAADALKHEWLCKRTAKTAAPVEMEVLKSMRRIATASHFKRACLSMMAWSLTVEDQAQLEQKFKDMDKDGNGRISLMELKVELEKDFAVQSEEAKELFDKLDADEQICYSEFLAAALQQRVRMHEDALYATFERFDQQDKGYITAADLQKCLQEDFGNDTEAMQLVREMNKSDSDRVTREEFIKYLTTWEDDRPVPEQNRQLRRLASVLREGRAALAARFIDRQFEIEEKKKEHATTLPVSTWSSRPTAPLERHPGFTGTRSSPNLSGSFG